MTLSVTLGRVLAIGGSMLLLAGCLHPTPNLAVVPQGQPVSFEAERVVRALDGLAATTGSRMGLTGSARVTLEGPDFKLNRPQRIALPSTLDRL